MLNIRNMMDAVNTIGSIVANQKKQEKKTASKKKRRKIALMMLRKLLKMTGLL